MSLFKKEALDPKLDIAQIRKLLRILFIDDQSMGIVDALRMQGYNTFQKYDLKALAELEQQEYHLIFCDISGVGQSLSEDEGAGLIRLIKEQVKYPIVIAYSAASYQPGGQHEETMRKVADDVIKKDAGLEEYLAVIQEWGQCAFSAGRSADLLAGLLTISKREAQDLVQQVLREGRSSSKWQALSGVGSAAKTLLEIAAILHGLST